MKCADCEHVDTHIFDTTIFWIHLPTQDSFGKFAVWLGTQGYDSVQFNELGIRTSVQRQQVGRFVTALYGELNGRELAGTRILTTPEPTAGPADLGRVMAGDVFVNRFQSQWIVESMELERFESWFQPIVDATDTQSVYGNEALLRMRDATGTIIPPGHIFRQAEDSDLLFALDLLARRSAVETAARSGLPGKVFINFNPSSIYDPSYCLRTTAAAIESLGMRTEDIVFEVTETQEAQDKAHLKGILAFYRRAGFGVALDDIGSGYSGLNMLHELRPDYCKIDMDLVRDVDSDTYKQTIVENLISIARRNRVVTVAEGIETAQEADWLINAGADLLQGYYYGRPAALETAAAA